MRAQQREAIGMNVASIVKKGFVPVVCLLTLGACSDQSPPAQEAHVQGVEVVRISQPVSAQVREFSGRVEQTSISPLAAEVSGRVVEIGVLDGMIVKRGQLIARIDPEPYELQLQRTTAQYQQLSSDLERKRQLRDERILSQGALEQLEAATEVARVQRNLAQRDLRNTRLLAPFDGRLASRNVELEQTVQAGVPIFNLENTGRLDVSVDLPQVLVQRLPLNQSLKAVAWLPEKPDVQFPLSYREHATQGSGASGVFRLVFSGKRPADVALLAGMSMRVRIDRPDETAAGAEGAAQAIPVTALVVGNNGSHHVWRFDEQAGVVHAVPVSVQAMQQDEVLIQSPLNIGDPVVAAGSQFLREGQRVSAMTIGSGK